MDHGRCRAKHAAADVQSLCAGDVWPRASLRPFASMTRIRFEGWLRGISAISAGCPGPPRNMSNVHAFGDDCKVWYTWGAPPVEPRAAPLRLCNVLYATGHFRASPTSKLLVSETFM